MIPTPATHPHVIVKGIAHRHRPRTDGLFYPPTECDVYGLRWEFAVREPPRLCRKCFPTRHRKDAPIPGE